MSNPPANKPDDFDAFTIVHESLRFFLEALRQDPRLAGLADAVFFLHVRRALARLAEIWTGAHATADLEPRLTAIPEKERARMHEIANKAAAEQPDFKDASDARNASAPYRPTDEQRQHPLCNALFMSGVTEREAIEALWRADRARDEHMTKLLPWKPLGPITIGGVTYTNPTADRLAKEGRAKALAEMMKTRLASLRRSVESGNPVDIVLDLANVEDLIGPMVASLAAKDPGAH